MALAYLALGGLCCGDDNGPEDTVDNKGKHGRPTSWICTCIASGEVFEFFTKSNADKARDSGLFKVEEAGEYLGRINREAKE